MRRLQAKYSLSYKIRAAHKNTIIRKQIKIKITILNGIYFLQNDLKLNPVAVTFLTLILKGDSIC